MDMPLRLIERICPLGRTLAVPPPRSETVRPGGGRFPALPLPAAGEGRPPAAFGLPTLEFGRPAVFGRFAPGLVRFVVVFGRVVFGRLFVVFARFVVPVFVRLGVVVPLGVVARPLLVLCDGVEWFCGALCAGALGFDGAAFGALPLCSWFMAKAGIVIASRRTNDFCSIHPHRDARTREL